LCNREEEEDVAEGFIDLGGDMTADSESARGRGSRKWCPGAATAASCENQKEEEITLRLGRFMLVHCPFCIGGWWVQQNRWPMFESFTVARVGMN
jgi:hypothetical protein